MSAEIIKMDEARFTGPETINFCIIETCKWHEKILSLVPECRTIPDSPLMIRHENGNYQILFKGEDKIREDGTPLDIPPFLEVKGYKGKYLNGEEFQKKWKEGMMWSYFMEPCRIWRSPITGRPAGGCKHYILYTPITKPTTIEDLFAEGTVCYLHSKNGGFHQVLGVSDDRFTIRHNSKWSSLKDITSWNYYRYSNSPLTKWEDAKPFVGKEEA